MMNMADGEGEAPEKVADLTEDEVEHMDLRDQIHLVDEYTSVNIQWNQTPDGYTVLLQSGAESVYTEYFIHGDGLITEVQRFIEGETVVSKSNRNYDVTDQPAAVVDHLFRETLAETEYGREVFISKTEAQAIVNATELLTRSLEDEIDEESFEALHSGVWRIGEAFEGQTSPDNGESR